MILTAGHRIEPIRAHRGESTVAGGILSSPMLGGNPARLRGGRLPVSVTGALLEPGMANFLRLTVRFHQPFTHGPAEPDLHNPLTGS